MSFIYDVNSENFASDVIQASHETPVVVDFWATWCGPCQTLLPILSKLAEEYAGKFRLAKVEIDQQPELANQFAVRSVPTVKIIKQGKIVDEFMGAIPENQIRDILDRHIENEADQQLQQALLLYQQGDSQAAMELMQQIMLAKPDNHQVRIQFANMLLREGHFSDARDLLNSLPVAAQQDEDAKALFAQLTFIDIVTDAPDLEELEQRVQQQPDSKSRYQLSAHYLLRGMYTEGMEQLLQIIASDRNFQDDAGRKTLLQVFDLLGANHPLVADYRRKLARMLY